MDTSSFEKIQVKEKVRVGEKLLIVAGILAGAGALGFLALFFFKPADVRKNCAEFAKDACLKQSSCQAIYNQDGSFSSCIQLSADILSDLREDKSLCASTGGEWQKTEYGAFCNCSQINKIFKPQEGCT